MSLATEKDEVLTRLNETWEIDLMADEFLFPEAADQRFCDMFSKHRFELELGGFIEYEASQGAVIEIERTRLKPAGYVFLLNGGYTAIERKLQLEEARQKTEWKWRRGYEGASLFTAILAMIIAALTYAFTPRSNDIEALQTQIDSLRKEVKQLQKLKADGKSASRQDILPPGRIPGR